MLLVMVLLCFAVGHLCYLILVLDEVGLCKQSPFNWPLIAGIQLIVKRIGSNNHFLQQLDSIN